MFEVALGRKAVRWQGKRAKSVGEAVDCTLFSDGSSSHHFPCVKDVFLLSPRTKTVKAHNRLDIKVTLTGPSFLTSDALLPGGDRQFLKSLQHIE